MAQESVVFEMYEMIFFHSILYLKLLYIKICVASMHFLTVGFD